MTDTTSKDATAPTIPARPILKMNSFKKDNEVVGSSDTLQQSQPLKAKGLLANIEQQQSSGVKQSNSSAVLLPEQDRNEEVLQYVQTHYPKCFPPPPETPLPLAIKIHEQLLAQKISVFSNTAIRKFLAQYTRTKEYRNAKKTIGKRYNLDGSFAGDTKDPNLQGQKDKNAKGQQAKLPHDSLFKRIMENDLAAREFVDEYLPAEVKDLLDLNTIKVQKESYIEPNLTKRLSDIVYSVNTKDNNEAFIYAIAEHQSSVDPLMSFRLWRYILLLAERHIKDKTKLPLIFPIVVYAGSAKYTAPRSLWQLFDNPDLAKKILTEDHALVDLQAISDDDIAKKKHLALFEYMMKHVHMRDMLTLFKNLFEKLPHAIIIDKEHGYFYIKNLLWYIDSKLPLEQRDTLSSIIIEHLPKNEGEQLMKTIADDYIEQGVHKGILIGEARGREEGIKKTAINMLKQQLDPKVITAVTGLTLDEILKLKNSTQFSN